MTCIRQKAWGLLFGAWCLGGCGPSTAAPPVEAQTSGVESGTTSTGDAAGSTSSTDESSSGTGEGSSTGGPLLPCAWVEGASSEEAPEDPDPSETQCDPEINVATLRLQLSEGLSCSGPVADEYLIVNLPPELQRVGEYDLSVVDATVRFGAEIGYIQGQPDSGTLSITAVTPTAVIGTATASLEIYDFTASFEAPYCP